MKFDFKTGFIRYLYRWIRIGREFKALWKNYLYQSFLATVVIFIVLWILKAEEAVIVASIGSTAFIVFTMPSYPTAKSRRVIGGHTIGFACGVMGILILSSFALSQILVYAIVVGASIFLMVVLDVEHAPASGTALGVAMSGYSLKVMLAILTSSVILSLAHHYLKKHLRDLI